MSIYEASITNPKKQLEFYKDLSEQLQRENQQLNEDIKVLFKENCNKEEVIKKHEDNWNKLKEHIKSEMYDDFIKEIDDLRCENSNLNYKLYKKETQQKEFINYLEDEKDRLARECSNVYEDSLGHTRLVNEDIFDEINDVLQKYKEIIGVKDEKDNN